jgi:hypothetical protein
MPAIRAADAGEAVLKVAALEELADSLVEDRPPVAELAGVALGVGKAEVVEVLTDEAVEVGFEGPPGAVKADCFVEEAGHAGSLLPNGRASVRGNMFAFC